MAKKGSEVSVPGEPVGTQNILLSDLVPNPKNSNSMDPVFLEKLEAHIKNGGRYPHLIVRPHPEQEGKYELIDGFHRRLALEHLGHQFARCDVWKLTDREAKMYLATLNRLRGEDIPVRRASLVHDLLLDYDLSDLAGLLPENEEQIEYLQNLLEFPAGDIVQEMADKELKEEAETPIVMTFVVMPDMVETIESAVEAASDGTVGRDRKARGLFNLAKRFLEAAPAGGVE